MTEEEFDEFKRNRKATLAPLPEELQKDIGKIFSWGAWSD